MILAAIALTITSNVNIVQDLLHHSDGSLFVGRDAGYYYRGDSVSHIFIGPYAGVIWRGPEKPCPLFILTDNQGHELITIDRVGRIRRKVSRKKLREAFKHYDAFNTIP